MRNRVFIVFGVFSGVFVAALPVFTERYLNVTV